MIFSVELHDLKLRHEKVGEWDRVRALVEVVGDGDLMTHRKSADEDIELAAICGVKKEKAPMAVDGIEETVFDVPQIKKERRRGCAVTSSAHEVDVFVIAGKDGRLVVAETQVDCDAAEETKSDAVLLGCQEDATSFLGDLAKGGSSAWCCWPTTVARSR